MRCKFRPKYPQEWELIKKGLGQTVTENGLFTYAPVHLNHKFSKYSPEKVDPSIKYATSNWYMVSVISLENELSTFFINSPIDNTLGIIKDNTYLIALIAVFSILVGYLVYINRLKYYRIKYISEFDPLTKTFNRRAGYKKISNLITKSLKQNTTFSLCFIDINGLKSVNDNLGHEIGDSLLKNVASCVLENIREKDFVVRLGGDEFLIILDGINVDDAEKVWDRIVECFDKVNKEEDYSYIISVSHGLTEYSKKYNYEIDTLVQIADEKMYKEKQNLDKDLNIIK